jgi:hypothetical protein
MCQIKKIRPKNNENEKQRSSSVKAAHLKEIHLKGQPHEIREEFNLNVKRRTCSLARTCRGAML